MWLGYIPSNVVDDLAAQIKAKQSKFYTGNANPVARDLASRVNSGFNIRSVAGVSGNSANPNGVITPNGLNNGGPADVTSASQSAKERQDAIIGVVSALGGIALLVLVFLVYRSLKRRRQLKHRRLSDPPQGVEDPFADDAGVRPEGREFDEDSMGAPRRRSFYFAEDSLRAAGVNTGAVSPVQVANSQVSLSQRRPVVTPGAISAPILRESSMNW
ncbi:hypothetical protein BJ165DRAFT_1358178 [Panaeolus papilionaceus]|nr:hypothetical protein BJ165DRAFT_1358178 [Panaeolus papilionaceus]